MSNILTPTLKRKDIVMIDNLPAHKAVSVREAIEARRTTLRYLPKYSPDLNTIEMSFSKLKADLRKAAERTIAVSKTFASKGSRPRSPARMAPALRGFSFFPKETAARELKAGRPMESACAGGPRPLRRNRRAARKILSEDFERRGKIAVWPPTLSATSVRALRDWGCPWLMRAVWCLFRPANRRRHPQRTASQTRRTITWSS
jgi:hypothetical protein